MCFFKYFDISDISVYKFRSIYMLNYYLKGELVWVTIAEPFPLVIQECHDLVSNAIVNLGVCVGY